MISFAIPEEVQNQAQMYQWVAENVMRPDSRKLDENEHERPTAFIDATWPFVQQFMKARMGGGSSASDKQASEKKSGEQKSGPNWGMLSSIMMIEHLSWGDTGQYLSMPSPALGGSAVQAVGTPEQKLRIFSRWLEGTPKWGGMAITEANAGSDNSSMRTTAKLDPETNEWIINGEKLFITNGKLALDESDGFIVVWATIDPNAGRAGIKSFVVEAGTPGAIVARQEHKLGIRASDTVALTFKDARVPYENLLGSAEVADKSAGSKGFKGAMKTFDASRPSVAASAIGIARAAVEFTHETLAAEGIKPDYRKPRHQWTAVERDLVKMEAEYKAAWYLVLKATAQMTHGENNRLEASMCKYRAGEAVTWVTQKSVELLGPVGYSRETLAEKWMRDAKIKEIYEGTRQINQLIVARSILGYSRRELS
ncbi:MAG: acyl-CoA dehydrogenase family protein [Chloroflexota bacterium]